MWRAGCASYASESGIGPVRRTAGPPFGFEPTRRRARRMQIVILAKGFYGHACRNLYDPTRSSAAGERGEPAISGGAAPPLRAHHAAEVLIHGPPADRRSFNLEPAVGRGTAWL